jgi:hypothetical protein
LAKGGKVVGFLFFGMGFLFNHHGKAVADGINQLTYGASQALLGTLFVKNQFYRRLANRANQQVQKLLMKGQRVSPEHSI